MPVVGQKYRQISSNITFEIIRIDNGRVRMKAQGWPFVCKIEDFWHDTEELPPISKTETTEEVNTTTNPVDLEKEEVNEVERALEKAKEELKIQYPFGRKILSVEDYYRLKTATQNLVNALESKPEPKIDIKEDRVEPVSIWKDVSELPKHDCKIYLKWNSGYIQEGNYECTMNGFSFGRGLVNYASDLLDKTIGYCTLTDFINSFEQMQKDIEELKKGRK